MKIKLSFLFLFFTLISFGQNGTVSGVVSDKDMKNEPLPFANVTIKGTTFGATTDMEGKYTIEVPEGSYSIVFSFLGYESKEVVFTVKANEKITISETIGSGSVKMEDVVVKATIGREKETALLLEQKKAVEIKQSIGAQEMARKGVSNVEQGLTKITGISKVGSRGLFVRGLEDRYNNLLINDLAAPSNNPFRKIIALDMFSSDIVSVIDVYKTFNPSISGDFAGATFNIITSLNTKSQTKVSIGVGYTTDNNLRPFLMSEDANTTKGFFGLNGKDREIPKALGNKPSNHQLSIEESQKSFKSGWDVDQTNSPLNSSIGFLHTQKFTFGNNKGFSYLLSLNADNSFSRITGADNTFDTNGTYNNKLTKTENHYKTSVAALLGLNYKSNRFSLTSNTFYLRATDAMIQDQVGAFSGLLANENVIVRTNQLDQSDYINTQLLGDYSLTEDKNHMLRSGVSFAKTSYQQPDRKFFRGSLQTDGNALISYGANNFIRQYLDITSDSYASGFLEYNWKFGKEDKNKLSLGYNGNAGNTETSYRFIKTNGNTNFTAPVNSIDAFVDYDLAQDNFNYQENSNTSYKTKLNENNNAGYTNLLIKIGDSWEVNGGVRVEQFNRELKYRFNGSFDDPFLKKAYEKLYVLPSINVKYKVMENANIRFAASKNYTKPVTMEVLPISYVNGDGTSIQGNPYLLNSDNLNADLKFELFPSNKEMFAVGLFAKHLDNPIERTYQGEAGGKITTFLNSEKADLYGVEAEVIFDLGRINHSLDAFSFGLNTSAMTSKVNVNPFRIDPVTGIKVESAETHQERELQGASKWLINSDLKYQFDFSKTWSNTASLVYSVFGKRIYSVGSLGLDHIYELPVHQLDFVWSSKLSDHYALKFGVNNILNPSRKQVLGDDNKIAFTADTKVIQEYKKGVGFSLNLTYSF
ncbi:TonB-dependent receptor [Flavobacterium sp.]|uniref:TonB-dependent receptor n=1 Tax=Flavobacterium sp. TaxID=239 RepID=UPI0026259F9B|nr:TonB-dependent receptor [Flavobacterium sp.]